MTAPPAYVDLHQAVRVVVRLMPPDGETTSRRAAERLAAAEKRADRRHPTSRDAPSVSARPSVLREVRGMKRQFRQAYVEPTSEQDEFLQWQRAHREEAQIQSRPTRGYVNPSDIEKARLVWQEAQIPKSKPLTDPQAEKLGKALRSAVVWYQMAA